MLGRVLGAGLFAALAGCYSPPEPDCGFACGPGGACPADYSCASDHVCHHTGFSGTCPARTADAAADAAPFAIVSTNPADGATGVSVGQVIVANVDRDVDGVDSTTFSLEQDATPVAGTASYSLGSFHLRFVPALQLDPNTTYTAVIGTGIHAHNADGNLMPATWSFTTGADTVVPHLAQSNPMANAVNVPTTSTVTLYFDEPVMGVDTTSVTVTAGVTPVVGAISATDAHTYVFTPTAALAAATTYTVALTNAITDNYGNALAPVSFTFTTQ
ncbi:MAG: Ig-like domain-containing protein [Deltaproteobacteria bacterium]|nr:Ig-like domain-containing protein [Deltaproteobacteria bacterium]